MAHRVVYKCPDGRDFPVDWEDPSEAERTWRVDREHFIEPATPLERATMSSQRRGLERAFGDLGIENPLTEGARSPHGFIYVAQPNFQRMSVTFGQLAALSERHGGPSIFWGEVCLPKVRECCRLLDEMGGDASIVEIRDLERYSWAITITSALSEVEALRRLEAFCRELLGEDGPSTVGDLAQGHLNTSVETAAELWQLADMVKEFAPIRDLLVGADVPWSQRIERLKEHKDFWRRFEDFLGAYGDRAEVWQLSSPTWRERPETPLSIVAGLVRGGVESPLLSLDRAGLRRQERFDAIERLLAGSPEELARFRALAAITDDYAKNRESRAHWQLTGTGKARLAWLRVGERLVLESRIEQPDDIFFLLPEEVASTAIDLRAAVEDRKQEWQSWRAAIPPPFIGADPGEGGASPFASIVGTAEQAGDHMADVIHGVSASKGLFTGRARIIASPADGVRLSKGEVMVCQMTAPPWTPLFAIAGAVVTETGGALAHAAIVAREYGIPAVVGARGATRRILDGDTVTVDGTNGIVRLGV